MDISELCMEGLAEIRNDKEDKEQTLPITKTQNVVVNIFTRVRIRFLKMVEKLKLLMENKWFGLRYPLI